MPPWKRRGRSERSRRPVSALPFRLPDTRASNSTCGTAASHLGGFVTAQLRPGTVWVAASDTICTCERRSRRIHRRRNWISMLIASFKPPGGLRRTPARCVASSLRGKTPARSATGSTGGEIPTATRTAKKKKRKSIVENGHSLARVCAHAYLRLVQTLSRRSSDSFAAVQVTATPRRGSRGSRAGPRRVPSLPSPPESPSRP